MGLAEKVRRSALFDRLGRLLEEHADTWSVTEERGRVVVDLGLPPAAEPVAEVAAADADAANPAEPVRASKPRAKRASKGE